MSFRLSLARGKGVGLYLALAVTLLAACSPSSLSGLPQAPTPSPPATTGNGAQSTREAAPTHTLQPTIAASTPGSRQTATSREEATAVPAAASPTRMPVGRESAVLVGAGDIASCGSDQDEKTANLLDGIEGTVFTLGDNAYDDGSTSQYRECYEPTWGRFKDRTRPAPGNHEYKTEDAAPYFKYFGEAVGDPKGGYYSYDLGAWHVVVLNSNCKAVGGCGEDSPQVRWLQADLADHPALCTLAYWHHPRFTSGKYDNNAGMRPLWEALYEADAEIVMSGHDHNYQRYAPQDPDGRADPAGGIRQFVVGTGGKSLYDIEHPGANLEVSNDRSYGVLKLTLGADNYDWEFIPTERGRFTDSGSGTCH